jgi:hypothetical protein
MKLKQLFRQQGEENLRQSQVMNKVIKQCLSNTYDYLKSIEILNRQSLPLRSNYNRKVQEYLIKNDQF